MFSALFTADVQDTVNAYVRRLASDAAHHVLSLEASCILADGDERWVRIDGVNLLEDADVHGLVLSLVDTTDKRRELEQLIRDSAIDRLTGLGNRRALQQALERLEAGTIVLIDVDLFKAVNDTYGHLVGDQVLTTVAGRLEGAFGTTGSVYRVGGDEFVAVLPRTPLETAWGLAETALVSLGAPIGEEALHITASIGIAQSDVGGHDEVLARADAAMYTAKATRRGTIVIAEPEPVELLSRRRAAHQAVRHSEAQLMSEIVRLEEASRRDDRTGLLNAAAYEADIVGVDALARQDGTGYAVALCDIDYFGAYNKRYLFEPANLVLRRVADALRAVCRPGDLVYRWGGEELVVVLPNTRLPDAAALGERLRAAVEALAVPHENRPPPNQLTISVGVAAFDREQHEGPADVFAAANEQLLVAKSLGRNLVQPEFSMR
jgi:diguanylate cyclase (GGDEF)-like protein